MAPTSALDHALIESAAAAGRSAHAAKSERARVMDMLIDLLFERAEMRGLMLEAVPYLLVCPPSTRALADEALMPRTIAYAMEEMLKRP